MDQDRPHSIVHALGEFCNGSSTYGANRRESSVKTNKHKRISSFRGLWQPSWTSDTVQPVNKLTVSVVGGGSGGRLSLEAAANSEWYELVALADLRPEVGSKLRLEFPELQFFSDYREMFRVCPTDVVCVSTYPPSHEEIALEH
jgi:hypothetical protein